MFGYIRPLQGELKVYELERFNACYCGLCHALGRKYGFTARFLLNYELVFLTMLLWESDETPSFNKKCCPASPFRKKRYCESNQTLDDCAGYTVILAWNKIKDTIADEKFSKSILHRLAIPFIYFAYKKAVNEHPDFDKTVRNELQRLRISEQTESTTSDEAADAFSKILVATAPGNCDLPTKRARDEVLYHIGRWIYIIDACDDYEKDYETKSFNPISDEYIDADGTLSDYGIERLKMTLNHSNNLLNLAYELMPGNYWTEIVKNTIYLGMPDVLSRVFAGTWAQFKKNGILK